MDEILIKTRHIEEELKENVSFINCDVRYFNFDYLTSKLGEFDGRIIVTQSY